MSFVTRVMMSHCVTCHAGDQVCPPYLARVCTPHSDSDSGFWFRRPLCTSAGDPSHQGNIGPMWENKERGTIPGYRGSLMVRDTRCETVAGGRVIMGFVCFRQSLAFVPSSDQLMMAMMSPHLLARKIHFWLAENINYRYHRQMGQRAGQTAASRDTGSGRENFSPQTEICSHWA